MNPTTSWLADRVASLLPSTTAEAGYCCGGGGGSCRTWDSCYGGYEYTCVECSGYTSCLEDRRC
jgi:hypothetical protein